MLRGTRTTIIGLIGATLISSSAIAGGYSRGSANLDPLFDTGNSVTTSAAVVAPNRSFDTINGTPAGAFGPSPVGTYADEKFSETYYFGAATAAIGLTEDLRCAGTYSQPFGANADYGWSKLVSGIGTTTSSELSSHEFGATCAYGMDAGKGRFHFVGGVFYESINYDEARAFGYDSFATGSQGADISMSDGGVGYRAGVAYTIPEIALKASLIYRSEVSHTLTGLVRSVSIGGPVSSFADASLPQSVKLSVQSGIAPGWLAFGSVEWTDWSVLQQVQVYSDPGTLAVGPVALPGVTVDAFFRDGWTVSGGVGHAFNDKFSGSLSLTWDRGVSPGQYVSGFSDTWTVAVGGAYNPSEKLSIRGGVSFSSLQAITYTELDADVVSYDTDYAIGGGLSLVAKF